jgi:hypothetical protein
MVYANSGSKFGGHRMTFVLIERRRLYRRIDQHDMIVGMRLFLKVTIALFGTSFSRRERPCYERNFLAFA